MIAITNGRVMTITQGILEPGTVLIEGGRIVALGEEVEIPEDAQIYDAAGKVVMPGMIDPHCHVGIFPDGYGWQNADGNEMTDPITPHLRALDAIHQQHVRERLYVKAARIEVRAVLDKVDGLKTAAAKRRNLEEALANLRSDPVPDDLQGREIALLEEALRDL